MNFFAHFLLARQVDSPLFHCGSLLPDIAKRAGVSIVDKQIEPFFHLYPHLIEGIRLHWHSDRLFHQSSLFEFATQAWKIRLESSELKTVSKKFFLNHLLAEMWLDRVLLEKHQGVGMEMYSSLEKVSFPELSQFSSLALNDHSGKLESTFSQFSKRKFILAYPDKLRFSEIASGVFGQVTQQPDTRFLMSIIGEVLEKLKSEEEPLLSHWNDFKGQFS